MYVTFFLENLGKDFVFQQLSASDNFLVKEGDFADIWVPLFKIRETIVFL